MSAARSASMSRCLRSLRHLFSASRCSCRASSAASIKPCRHHFVCYPGGGGWLGLGYGAVFSRMLCPKKGKQGAAGFLSRACPPQEQPLAIEESDLFPPYLSVGIRCRKRDADCFSDALLSFGANSASMDDSSELDDSDVIYITSIFTYDQDVHLCITSAAKAIGLENIPNYEVRVRKQFNWIDNFKETFEPIQVTEGLWVVPEWRTPPDIQAKNIILNPGMAFGTGDHPTTKLCLLLLHKSVKGGEVFLDYGTGSGVLGIAALKMGAALCVGIDVDPTALSSARHNITINAIEPAKMELYLVQAKGSSVDPKYEELKSRKKKFDIIIANILLNPLLELAEEIASFGKPGAVVGLSGIITEQIPAIEEKYTQYLECITITEMDGWACLAGVKKGNP